MTHEQARQTIMEHMTVELIYSFKAVDVDFWQWLEWAADLAVDVYTEKHKAA